MSCEVNCWYMCLLKVTWSWLCGDMFVHWCNLCDTNINVSNAIKLSHFEVKDLCETKCDALSIIENVLIYINHILNAIKWDSVSQSEYARIIESTMFW